MKFPIPQDWDGATWCRWSICWPDSEVWAGLLRGLITLPMRGWTWDERTGSILAVQEVGKEIFSQNLPLNGVIMACNDDNILTLANIIAAAIRDGGTRQPGGQCCGSIQSVITNTVQGFVPSSIDGSSLPIWGSVPPVSLPESGYPDGYTSMEEYLLERCRLAHQTVDGAIGSLRGLGAITVFNLLTIGGLVVASVLTTVFFPPAAIPALLGMMLLLTAGLGILVNLADLMQEHRGELICALYTSNTVANMIVAVEAIMTTIVVALPVATAFQILCKGIAMMFFSSDSLNGMMSYTAALGYPDAVCPCGDWWECAIGVIIESDATSITLEGVQAEGFDAIVAVSYADTVQLVQLSAEVTDWTPPSDIPEFASSWDDRSALCGAGNGSDWQNISNVAAAGPVTARTFQHRANTTFRVKYTRSA